MRLLLLIALFLGTAGVCRASTYGTPNSIAAQTLAKFLDFQQQGGKPVPQTWEEWKEMNMAPVDKSFPYVLPTRRYAFITNDVKISEGRILLIMRSPFRDTTLYLAWYGRGRGLRERGRWAIFQDEKSVIRARYLKEDEVVASFARAGVPLPEPDDLGEWQHEKDYRHMQYIKLALGSVVLGAALAFLYRRFRPGAKGKSGHEMKA